VPFDIGQGTSPIGAFNEAKIKMLTFGRWYPAMPYTETPLRLAT